MQSALFPDRCQGGDLDEQPHLARPRSSAAGPPCKTPADRRLRHRCQALCMAARGWRHPPIAPDQRVTSRPRPRWRQASRTEGLDGLPLPRAPGRSPADPSAWPLRWGPGASTAPPTVAWTAPLGPLPHAPSLWPAHRAGRSARGPCGRSAPTMADTPRARPPRPSKVILAPRQGHAWPLRPSKKAAARALGLVSQDEARFAMLPPLRPP
jgi:hypothetical protein